MQMTKKNMADVVTCIGVAAILSVIVFTIPNEIPIGEMAYQKLSPEKTDIVSCSGKETTDCKRQKQQPYVPTIVSDMPFRR